MGTPHAEPGGRKAYLKQYVDRPSGRACPFGCGNLAAKPVAAEGPVAPICNGSNGGCSRSDHE
jgi:hypothetical protein